VSPTKIPSLLNQSMKKSDRICTAGSCFAQHITNRLKPFGFNIIDYEPPPNILDKSEYIKHGFSQYSCRYGNIYTVRQLLQLVYEAFGEHKPQDYIWEKDNRFYDALRPNIFPNGLSCPEEVSLLRKSHLSKVKKAFLDMDVFIFTLGLTESWFNQVSDTVYPTCPGVIAGKYDPNKYSFVNYDYIAILNDLKSLFSILKKYRKRGVKTILTVSPVPLTATATSLHILQAVAYSKSVLRAVAGYLSSQLNSVDYFPSYEIVNNPMLHGVAFEANGRTVKPQIVDIVIQHLFKEHSPYVNTKGLSSLDVSDVACEELLLEEFA
jgi:hypothetical protein